MFQISLILFHFGTILVIAQRLDWLIDDLLAMENQIYMLILLDLLAAFHTIDYNIVALSATAKRRR